MVSRIFFTLFYEHRRLDYSPEAVCACQRAEQPDFASGGVGFTAGDNKHPKSHADEQGPDDDPQNRLRSWDTAHKGGSFVQVSLSG